ncbi:MAG TPA: MFS transporter [Arsenicitalea sp.]|jgi:FSR family fosmidomycin resistance protein-like MFS transporter|nr:MFS transporter [Arsenicitalea sp.]
MTDTAIPVERASAEQTAFTIIMAVSFCHLLNDMMQSLLTATYPLLKANYGLDFGQIGLLTLTYQMTASLLQPLIGMYTDKRPLPYSLPFGMASTLVGLVVLAHAGTYEMLLVGAALVGLGSSVFHPESSRVARIASGGRFGLAQSLFQVGGNFGTAIGPLLAAFIVVPKGQQSIEWFSIAALVGMVVLWRVGVWYAGRIPGLARGRKTSTAEALPRRQVITAVAVLVLLVMSKYVYLTSISSYYTFYVIHKFDVSVQNAQLLLFLYLGAVAVGTVAGGALVDRLGTKFVIWFSILGTLPFTLALPYANLPVTAVLTVIIGLIIASAFSAIVVFAQELLPGRVGLIAGLFFGLAFGVGGVGAAVLGEVADLKGIDFVYLVCSFLPLGGLLTVFLPNIPGARRRKA